MKLLIILLIALVSRTSWAQEHPLPVTPGKKITSSAAGKSAMKTSARHPGKELKFRLYGNHRLSSHWKRKLTKEIKWWMRTANKYCKSENFRFSTLKELTGDYSVLMFTKAGGGHHKIYRFQTTDVAKPAIPSYEWIKGFETLRSDLSSKLTDERKTDAMKTIDGQSSTFHIVVFKELYALAGGNDAMIPGIVHDNILALKGAARLMDMQHEVGHLFGLEDDKGGIMTKIHPDGFNSLVGRYDNERKYGWKIQSIRDYRCQRIKSHFGF